jgi:hypothetical protein
MKKVAFLFLFWVIFFVKGAIAYPVFVEDDIKILCAKYSGILNYKNSNKRISCDDIRNGYLGIYMPLERPIFSDLEGVLDAFKKRNFRDVMKKDFNQCVLVEPQKYDCSMGDMRMYFYLNSNEQVLRTTVKINSNSQTFKQMLSSGNRPNQENETKEYKDLIYESIAKASAKVNGKYIKTEFYSNELILTFLNKAFN